MNYIGDPEFQTDYWEHQGLNDNCALVAQTSILDQFGVDLTQEEACYIAYENGWYNPGFGTSPEDMGNLLEAAGVPVHNVQNATILDLAHELQQGHRVIVGVNSSELWEQGHQADFWNWIKEAFGLDTPQFNPADHAICVTGIDMNDPSNPQIIINDSGVADGAGKSYPLDQFADAWQNSDFRYVATDVAPPSGVIPDFDIGSFLGIGTTLVVAEATGDIILASQAGEFVHTLCNEIDWDQIIAAV
jgi:hypothetical protein